MNPKTIQYSFHETVKQFHDRVAIEYGTRALTYGLLDSVSDAIACYLLERGYSRGSHIAVLMNDKLSLISSMLGILKLGGVFVPLNPSMVTSRTKTMIDIGDVQFILTDKTIDEDLLEYMQDGLPSFGWAFVENIPELGSDAAALAVAKSQYDPKDKVYLYFTSGTTGTPKAIIGQNLSLLHYMKWEIKTCRVTEQTRVSQFTSEGHDPYLRDVFVPLLAGGTICIPESKEVMLSSVSLVNWIENSKVHIIHCTPTLFRVFHSKALSPDNFLDLHYILLAGERIVPGELSAWYEKFGDRIQLVNLYGPTETTLAKLHHFIQPDDVNSNHIPIGKPIEGCKVILLDQERQICGKGQSGEIYIRTPYRTHGYYKDDELNGKSFIQNPFSQDPADIIYKTGDIGRILPDGSIEFLNRIDRQIKVRGHRVEISEIEKQLIHVPGVTECVVDYREDSEQLKKGLKVVHCIKCGLPSTYPNTLYSAEGVCNVCEFYETSKDQADDYFQSMERLSSLIMKAADRKKSSYDCMVLFSGGKDSTYVLYHLVEMGFKCLAFTFDNGYISDAAKDNIKKLVSELGVDHVFSSYPKMDDVFLEGLVEEHSVCNGCFKMLRILSTRMAFEKGIPFIVTGFSRGQIYDLRLSPIHRQNIFSVSEIEKKIFDQRRLYFGVEDYTLRSAGKQLEVTEEMLRAVNIIDYFRYSPVTKRDILEYLREKNSDWLNPTDTGVCSSNCLINDVGIFIQRKVLGYDNYTYPNSWEVRTGHITLEDFQKESDEKMDTAKIEKIIQQIGYKETIQTTSNSGYLVAYYVSDEEIAEEHLREPVETLPDYMQPAYFIRIDQMPMNANGKLDFQRLPDPKAVKKSNYVPPRDEYERKLEALFCEILGLEQVGIYEAFLKIGGNSLSVMNLVSMVYQEFEVEIALNDVFHDSTIEGIANLVREAQASASVVS